MSTSKRRIAITMGDASGIGPEIIVAAWPEITALCEPVVFGHPAIMRRAMDLLKMPVDMEVVRCADEEIVQAPAGVVDPRSGEAAFRCLLHAIELARTGRVDAIVTAPLHKESLHLAGHHYPGHTEILAEQCGVREFGMMLYLGAGENIRGEAGLAVDHVTLHTSMRSIFEQITIDSVLEKIRLIEHFMTRMLPGESRRKPRIGVCSLNPHAGEGGLFGREEIEIIRPAVKAAKTAGMDVRGPCPADTIMIDARNGRYDAVVAMFHDQGHIALKLLGMHRAVNITLGLPIIRTSVAHGTAFDIAWKGMASPGSMIEAVRVASLLADNKKVVHQPFSLE